MAINNLNIARQYVDSNGKPLSGGKVHFYENGSFSIPQTAYTGTDIPAANPTILDSSGNCPQIFGTSGSYYNVLVTDSGGTVVLTYTALHVPLV